MADDPNYPMPPEERLFAPEELRPLDEFPRLLAEQLREHLDLRYHLTEIRKHYLELRELAMERLSTTLAGVAIGSPDHMDKVFEWRKAINRGEVPTAFGEVKLLQAREILADHFYYGEILGLGQLMLERGLWRGLLGVGCIPTESDEPPPSSPPADREQIVEAAVALRRSLPDFLGAIQLILGVLTNLNPADLIRGRATLVHARNASTSKRYARGIQAAVNHVYRDGMTEQECWEALEAVDGRRFQLESRKYTFQMDTGDDGEGCVYEFTGTEWTKQERSVNRKSFYRYFKRAKQAGKDFRSVR